MSRVSYFQRFSQRENHATNNTLLIFRHFYQSSPIKLQRVLTSLADEELSIGLTFEQQIKGKQSVPDALISQKPLSIFIETKRGETLDADQITRHINSISQHPVRKGRCILLGISKESIPAEQSTKMHDQATKTGVLFATVTFSQILEALRAQCAEYEADLISIVDDYEEYLAEEHLLEERSKRLPIFPCGTSFPYNRRYKLYYEPPSRPCKLDYPFIGIYKEKQVRLVGRVEVIVVCSYENDNVVVLEKEKGHLTEEQREDVKRVMEETPYFDLMSAPQRFYFVDEFIPVTLQKTSPGGIRSLVYLDIPAVIGSEFDPRRTYTTQELADLLNGRTFA